MRGDRTALNTPDTARSRAVAYLLAARALRDFGDGFVAILLPVYLIMLGFSPLEIGAIATAALLGSALLTFGIGMIGPRHDRQRLLLAGASLMTATGVAFAFVHDFALLLVVAFAGTINPSAGSVSVFVPLEHAVLSGEVSDARRTAMFARYSLIGALSAAFGALAAASPQYLSAAGVEQLTAIKAMFVLYTLLGVAVCLLYSRIPRLPPCASAEPAGALGPSRHIVYRLAALFSLDAFAGGFVVQSLLALWLFERFDLSLAAASLFFFWSGVLSAFSFPVAAWLSRRMRLAKLAGGVAIIRVGGASETEVKERKDRVEDALHATRAAVQEGVVIGGGVALVRASKKLQGLEGANSDQTAGIAIVRKALQAPLRQIAENAGVDGSVVAGKITDSEDPAFGFNAQTEEYGDMFKFGVIDPAKVVRTALQDAASVAGLLITTEAMIATHLKAHRTAASLRKKGLFPAASGGPRAA